MNLFFALLFALSVHHGRTVVVLEDNGNWMKGYDINTDDESVVKKFIEKNVHEQYYIADLTGGIENWKYSPHLIKIIIK